VALCLRNERVSWSREPVGPCSVPGVIKSRHYAGGTTRCVITTAAGRDIVTEGRSGKSDSVNVGDKAYVVWDPEEAAVVR